jgi:hypothetical protein
MSLAPFIGIPKPDEQLRQWAQHFSDVINASPSAYALSLTDAANIKRSNDNFQAAYVIASTPATRTQVTVQAKNACRNAMLSTLRAYYEMIQISPGVTDANKIKAGIWVRSQARSRRLAPESQPILELIGATPGQWTLRFADATTPNKRGKPAGAKGLQLFVAIGNNAAADPTEARFLGTFTKQPVAVNFKAADAGQRARLWARWQGIRGDVGPWSNSVSMQVVGM